MVTMDERHWVTADGHLYRSVRTLLPLVWTRAWVDGLLVYSSSAYTIVRQPYGTSGWTFSLFREGESIWPLHGRLGDAQGRAVRNARGEDTVNVA